MEHPYGQAIPETQRIDFPAAGRHGLGPGGSSVAFRTRHLFGLAAVSGSMRVAVGEIVVDPAVPQASVTATVTASSFSTGNGRRVSDVRSPRFLHVQEYPQITFRAGILNRAQGRWTLTGEPEIRGVSKPVTLTIGSVEVADRGFRARATTRIDRNVFGLTAAKGMAARFLDIDLTAAAEPL